MAQLTLPYAIDAEPGFGDVLAAAARIAPHACITPVLRSRSLEALAGCELYLKAEHLQRVGAFKFRGACNAVWSLSDDDAARGAVTHSSGNNGAAPAAPAPRHNNGVDAITADTREASQCARASANAP